MSDDRKDLPTPGAPNFNERVRETLSTYLGKRGDPLDRGVTLRDLVDSGIVALTPGFLTRPGSYVPIAGPGTGIGDSEPDLTPPPTPTGFVVTPTFNNLIIEHDNPVYTQGHGHARTRVYGATYTSGALPIFSTAVLITEFTGTVFAHPTTLGTEWHLWIKWVSEDGVESTTPAGGTNGLTATTGRVGNSDLGPLIVEAANLAANAVGIGKFAIGIEPVTIITSGPLPTTLGTKFIFWTDFKLYRWNGTAYTASVSTADLDAQVTNAQIAALAASKITGTLTNAQIADLEAAKLTGQITTTQISDNAVSTPKLLAGAVTAGKIAANTITAGQIAAGTITATEIAAGTITGNKLVANTITAGQIAANTITAGQIAAGSITATEIAGTTITAGQLAAGAVIAGKIAANAIVAGDGVIQNAAITNALIANLAVDNAKIANGAISTVKIGDAQITAAKIADANITTAKIADANITTAKIADANITTAKIADANITTAKIGDAQVTSAKVGVLTAGNLTVGAISDTVNGGLGSGSARVEITANRIDVYDAGGLRVRLGLL